MREDGVTVHRVHERKSFPPLPCVTSEKEAQNIEKKGKINEPFPFFPPWFAYIIEDLTHMKGKKKPLCFLFR